jgi:hypothetical protein
MQFLGSSSPPCLPWCGSLGHLQSAKLLRCWSFKILFGWRIDLRREVDKIVAFASFATKSKNRPPAFSSIAGSLLECGPPSKLGLSYMMSTLGIGMTLQPSKIGGSKSSTREESRGKWWLLSPY